MPDAFLGAFNAILKEHYQGVIAVDGQFRARVLGRAIEARAVMPGPPPITPAVVVTLATLGAFEWLRHRKAEVARAEAAGDYSAILAEFVAWLRALLDSWRGAGA